MSDALLWLQGLALLPVLGGTIYSLLAAAAVWYFVRPRQPAPVTPPGGWPAVTVLKAVHGLEKNLERNLRSTCLQDYPEYQVVFSVQRVDDPALPILRKLEREFGPALVDVVVTDSEPVGNGKIENLLGGIKAARHDTLVISDSDCLLSPDYLKHCVAPLADPEVGCVCTMYRAIDADRWFEKLELLTMNVEFTSNLVFARVTGASRFCLGASTALERSVLDEIGGLEPLAEYLIEDFEMGRRIEERGHRFVLVPHFVDMSVDLTSAHDWWNHLVYWDQNTLAARRIGFFATVVIRAVPFALFFAALRRFDPLGWSVLGGTLAVRWLTAAVSLARIGDREGLRSLAWLPLRDCVGLAAWLAALCKRKFVWRGLEFGLERGGRIVPRHREP